MTFSNNVADGLVNPFSTFINYTGNKGILVVITSLQPLESLEMKKNERLTLVLRMNKWNITLNRHSGQVTKPTQVLKLVQEERALFITLRQR